MVKGNKVLFQFALIADSHLNPADAGNTSPWQTNHMANQRNAVVVEAINRLNPAFTIHVGDVVHPLPNTSQYDDACEYALDLYRRLKAPFYIAPGNHDIGDKWLPGNPAASITDDTCLKYQNHFGPQWQNFEIDGINFVILNACLLGSDLPQEHEQWAFLEQQLGARNKERTFVFSHYPPFITSSDENNHYDNIDKVPRKRLLSLLEESNAEALFAGHVHTFFLNKFKNTWSYALPSSTNFRQDYAELFRVNPSEELGRNDLGKFGFFLVDVYKEGHVARFIRTHGATDSTDVDAIVAQVGQDIRGNDTATIGVSFCHDWTSTTHMPFNPPLDTFVRKEARNDYFILNLWDCGIKNARIPAHDLIDKQARERVKMLIKMGHRISVFCVSPISRKMLEALQEIQEGLRAVELICTMDQFDAEIPEDLSTLPCPIYYAPIFMPPQEDGQTGTYDHTMASGITFQEVSQLLAYGNVKEKLNHKTGIVVRVEYAEPILETLIEIERLSQTEGFPIASQIRLSPDESYIINNQDHAQATRVAEAALGAMLHSNMIIDVDTFMDIDRGYFSRNGLVDRRHNLRIAGGAARELHNRLASAQQIKLHTIDKSTERTRFVLETEQGQLAFSMRQDSSDPWSPQVPSIVWETQ